ncbi:MAG: RHS repeat-associated core domain-containing protein [Firmicutes bacterium]|nr:RHS repeat-associated core domain-containing protein [Bacillota bacterium]
MSIEGNGYLYIYMANKSNEGVNVYFDDVPARRNISEGGEVQLIDAPVTNASDYYPFGLAMAGRSYSSEKYRFGYQGQFAEMDEETGWNSFELRMYEPVIGRWLTTDPERQYSSPYLGMGNDPISGIDPDGARKVYYNSDGTWSHTTHNNFFHNLFKGNQKFVGDQWGGFSKVSDSFFWDVTQSLNPRPWSGELKPVTPNFFGSIYNQLDNSEAHVEFTGKFIYGIVDDAYVSFFQMGKHRMHLDGTGAWPKEVQDAGINTLITLNPMTTLSAGIPSKTLNAGQFNSLFKGTGLNSAQTGAVKSYNHVIRNYHKLSLDVVPFLNGKGIYDTSVKSFQE